MMKIAVGTTSEQKIQYLNEVLSDFDMVAEIIANDVISGVSEQPITSEETRIGSMNRAKSAFQKNNSADFSIGVEIGYQLNNLDNYEILCWATIVDNSGKIISAKSEHFELPEFHQRILKDGKNLGDFVYEYVEKYDDENGILIANRKPYICGSIKNALVDYLG